MVLLLLFLPVIAGENPPCARTLGAVAKEQFLKLASHFGGYGLPISFAAATLVSKNPIVIAPIEAMIVALAAGQMAYTLRLFPWPEYLAKRPIEENLAMINRVTGEDLHANDTGLLEKLKAIASSDPQSQRTIATVMKFVGNNDLNGFPSADLSALTAGLLFLGFQGGDQSPFFALFASATILSCAYARLKFVPFHTWPQVFAGIATGIGSSFLAERFGVLPTAIAANLGALGLYSIFAEKTPKPVLNNAKYSVPFVVLIYLCIGSMQHGTQSQ